ncbi:NAD(P)-dependent glycerol-3-phosphate dehydrogenase, partial [Candidatus Poribacteria bacterium]|nr:NAD(P)-dependent glycerol-3-phosphate dehydrogenase [Candidatus Poribacteria bacterium]
TALAITAARAGNIVTLWALEPEVVASINGRQENEMFLPDIKLPDTVHAVNDLEAMLAQDALLMVAPAQYVGSTCEGLASAGLDDSLPIVICSKGIEQNSLKLMSEVVAEYFPNPLAILSGPTFAIEVAKGLPASVTLACGDVALGQNLAQLVVHPKFSVHHSDDMIGPQICGAMKNVIAIACGIVEGKGLGESAKAALITEGLAEISQLCVAKSGKPETAMGLCGLGDLILTCNSHTSRNMSLGYALGQGKTLEDILSERVSVAEGVASSNAVAGLADQLGIRLRICGIVDRIMRGEVDGDQMLLALVQG